MSAAVYDFDANVQKVLRVLERFSSLTTQECAGLILTSRSQWIQALARVIGLYSSGHLLTRDQKLNNQLFKYKPTFADLKETRSMGKSKVKDKIDKQRKILFQQPKLVSTLFALLTQSLHDYERGLIGISCITMLPRLHKTVKKKKARSKSSKTTPPNDENRQPEALSNSATLAQLVPESEPGALMRSIENSLLNIDCA